MTKPKDEKMYSKVKERIYKKYKTHSAYRSGQVVKEYKLMFAKKYGDKISPYIGSKPKKTGLARWFAEDWKSNTGEYKYTTTNSIYRPTKRITKNTPLTFRELTKKQIQKAKLEKAKTGRVKKFS